MRQRNWVLIVTGFVTTLVALVFAIGLYAESADLRSHGVRTTATVTDTRAARGTEYLVTFPTGGGATTREWTRSVPPGTRVGAQIPITYDPADPENLRPAGHTAPGYGFYLSLVFVLIGLTMAGSELRRTRSRT